MLTGIDHIVVVVPDLETAIKQYTELGFTVVPGGRHPIGTHNALIGFQDSAYIELIAFFEPNAAHRWYELLQKGGGLIDYCMATDNLDSDLAAFRAVGLPMTDRMPLSRVRPDGYKLDWVLSVAAGKEQGLVPFIIEDITPRSERIPGQNQHPNGVTGIGTLTFAVESVETVRKWFEGILKTPGKAVERPDLKASGVQFVIGPHGFDFLAPTGGDSPLAAWLQSRGSSLYAAALKTTGAQKGALDQAKALNARFTLV